MKFFIPFAEDEAQAEQVYLSTRRFVTEDNESVLSRRRIYSLDFKHEGKNYHVAVGEVFSRIHEIVIAILYHPAMDLYYVCTPSRGVVRGMPYLTGGNEVYYVGYFEQSNVEAQ